jgi:hypothetical protein
METPSEVLVYFEQIAGEPKRGLLLSISSQGYYEINLQTASGVRRVLLPIATTVLVSTDIEPGVTTDAPEIER